MESKNNNKQNSQISSGIIMSENSIYLKRSDLPKNVSSFNNDANYISEDALNEWLQNHSYLSESDIQTLIEKNNIVIINKVNKTSDENTIKQLETYIDKIKGEINAIKDKLNDYNTKIESLNSASIELQQKEKNYAKKSDIDDVKNKYASKEWVEGKKYLTTHQSLEDYAKKTEIPSLDGYVKKDDISSLSGYVTKTNLDSILKSYVLAKSVYNKDYINDIISEIKTTYAKKKDIESAYMTSDEIKNTFLTQLDAQRIYLSKEDYRGIKSGISINDTYITKSAEEIQEYINNGKFLIDGLYIIKNGDVAIIKNNRIISINGDRFGTSGLFWIEEE